MITNLPDYGLIYYNSLQLFFDKKSCKSLEELTIFTLL